jgi:hypothetical protein
MSDTYTPAMLAEKWGVSERHLRRIARELGACRVMGKAMWFTEDDVRTIEEAQRCRSSSGSGARSGTTEVRLPEGDYAALRASREQTRRPPSKSSSRSRKGSGVVVSMVRGAS